MTEPPPPILYLDGVSVSFEGFKALNDLSLIVDPGELRTIIGLQIPESGEVEVLGDTITDARDDADIDIRSRWGVLFQGGALFSTLTVAENVEVPLREFYPEISDELRHEIARYKVLLSGLPPEATSKYPSELSGGMKKRAGLARALALDPELLFLDEPTAGLDPKQIIETRQLIKHLAGDHTIILSTHILPEVSQTCQRVVIINKGRVVAIDTPENLTSRLRGSETMYVQVDAPPTANVHAAIQGIPGVTQVSLAESRGTVASYEVNSETGVDVRRQLAAAVVNGGWGLLELRPLRMSLEEIFLELTRDNASAADRSVA